MDTVIETRDALGPSAWTELRPPAMPPAPRSQEAELLGLLITILVVALVLALTMGTPPLV